MKNYGSTDPDPGWPGGGNPNWPAGGSSRPVRSVPDDVPVPKGRAPELKRMISVMLPKHRVGDEEDQVKGVGGHPVESSANFGRSLNAALHDGHLNSIEDLKGHKLPDNWMDMTHDWEGFKHFTLHGGIFLFLAMVVTTIAGLIIIYSGGSRIAVFWISILAVIPLAIQLGDISVLLSHWCGAMAGGLINATFSNATELLVLVSAVRHNLVAIEQAVLVGGVLSNMLFVLGVSFVAGGFTWRRGQTFDVRHARTDIGVLFVASTGVLLPTAFALVRSAQMSPAEAVKWTLYDSRETAAVLLIMYIGYLAFRLWPEAHPPPPPPLGSAKPKVANRRGFRPSDAGRASDTGPSRRPSDAGRSDRGSDTGPGDLGRPPLPSPSGEATPLLGRNNSEPVPFAPAAVPRAPIRAASLSGVPEEATVSVRPSATESALGISFEDLDKPMISAITCMLMLVVYAVLVAIFANALITSVFPVALEMKVPVDVIAVVLIPLVGNIAALFSSVVAATHDHLDLSLAVALGSATQIGMFLMPFAVFFGWIVGVPFTLDFETAYAVAFFSAVIAFSLLMMDGEAHWQKGCLLIGLYVIVVSGLVNTGFVESVGGAAAVALTPPAAAAAAGSTAAVAAATN